VPGYGSPLSVVELAFIEQYRKIRLEVQSHSFRPALRFRSNLSQVHKYDRSFVLGPAVVNTHTEGVYILGDRDARLRSSLVKSKRPTMLSHAAGTPSPPADAAVREYLKKAAMPRCVAERLVQVDSLCAIWIEEGLLWEMGHNFALHQLLTYMPTLILRIHGPSSRAEHYPVLLCDVPRAAGLDPTANDGWKREIWTELCMRFEHREPLPDYLLGSRPRVISALQMFFQTASTLNVMASTDKTESKVPAGLDGLVCGADLSWLGKKVPEPLLNYIIRALESEGYPVPNTEISQRDALARIFSHVLGSSPTIAAAQELSLLHLSPLGSADGAIAAQPGSYLALDHSTNTCRSPPEVSWPRLRLSPMSRTSSCTSGLSEFRIQGQELCGLVL
jgi:hypothetical protein